MLAKRPSLALLLAGLIAAGSAWAEPQQPDDSLSALLTERGLISQQSWQEAPSSTLGEAMRTHAADLVVTAMNFLGVPYRRGGSSADSGFDCSGFTRRVFELSLGIELPRRADEQAGDQQLVKVDRKDLKPGDLVFFNTLRRSFSHVGIYIGEGKFIHSPRSGGEVRVEDMRFRYWAKRFTGARRVDGAAESP